MKSNISKILKFVIVLGLLFGVFISWTRMIGASDLLLPDVFLIVYEKLLNDFVYVLVLMIGLVSLGQGVFIKAGDIQPLETSWASRYGWRGFLITFLVFSGTTFVVNPRQMFGLNIFPSILLGTRQIQIKEYRKLDYSPEFVLLGSSRSESFDSGYIKEKFGFTAFNFAVKKGHIDDFIFQTKFIETREGQEMPLILMVEVFPGIPVQTEVLLNQAPAAYLPFFDLETIIGYYKLRYIELFNSNQLIESLWIFQKVAYLASHPEVTELPYIQLNQSLSLAEMVQIDIEQLGRNCQGVTDLGKQKTDGLLEFAKVNNTFVIFFNATWHPMYYKARIANNEEYFKCQEQFEAYMNELEEQHENFSFLDFTHIDTIGGDPDGFIDAHHMTTENTNLLIDAAAETIQDAYEWASEQRGE